MGRVARLRLRPVCACRLSHAARQVVHSAWLGLAFLHHQRTGLELACPLCGVLLGWLSPHMYTLLIIVSLFSYTPHPRPE